MIRRFINWLFRTPTCESGSCEVKPLPPAIVESIQARRNACRFPARAASYAYRSGCRCPRCRRSNREKQRRLVADRRAIAAKRLPTDPCAFPKCAAATAYNYGCRCERCRSAQALRARQQGRRKESK
jgi:hypothetical protein